MQTNVAVAKKKKARKKREKRPEQTPAGSGPEGRRRPHHGGEDFDPHAHRAEYPHSDRDTGDPHIGSLRNI